MQQSIDLYSGKTSRSLSLSLGLGGLPAGPPDI